MNLSTILIFLGLLVVSHFPEDADGFRLRRAFRRVRVRIRLRRLAKPACLAGCSLITNAWGAAACRLACSRAKRDTTSQLAFPIEFEKYDTNGDQKISQEEFLDVSQQAKESIAEIFLVADTNKDTFLDESEFYTAPLEFIADEKDTLDKIVNDSDFDNMELDDA